MSPFEQLLQAIQEVDGSEQSEELFDLIPENLIWANAMPILDDPEFNDYGPTLLQSIHDSFTKLNDKEAACIILSHVLETATDDLTYRTAQSIIIDYAREWEKKFARKLYNLFEKSYQDNFEDGNTFIAQISLEGAVLLPIFREDSGLLHRAISLLIDDFPPTPKENHDAATLPVKALKLLSRCYDCLPGDTAIVSKVRECIDSSNYSVSNEARFINGIINLYNAFSASDENLFLSFLEKAALDFSITAESEERRTDAELLSKVIECYMYFLHYDSEKEIGDIVSQTKEILTERLLTFGGFNQTGPNDIEIQLVQLVTNFTSWADILTGVTHWPELSPPLHLLADIYSAVRITDNTSQISQYIPEVTRNFVMLPHLHGQFVQIQEIVSKMTAVLADEQWREATSPSEIEFCQLILHKLQEIPSPKEWAAIELEKVRMAALKDNPEFATFLSNFQYSGKGSGDGLIQLAWRYLNQCRIEFSNIPIHEGPAKEIHEALIPMLQENLHWDTESRKWKFLRCAVHLVVNYLIRIYRITPGEAAPDDVSFLFAEGIKGLNGKGKKAVEKDLENHFYKNIYLANFYGAIERQSMSIAPGRPDLNFRFQGDIIFPIEVKREFKDVSRDYIHEHYITQSQSYAAALHGIGFLFILDLTPKPLNTPLYRLADCCYIDHRPVPNASQDDFIIVVIFPANRPRPSDHSWKR